MNFLKLPALVQLFVNLFVSKKAIARWVAGILIAVTAYFTGLNTREIKDAIAEAPEVRIEIPPAPAAGERKPTTEAK